MDDLKTIVYRIREFEQLDKDYQVAELFGLTAQEFSRRKGRGTLLPDIIKWGICRSVDLNWLFKGHAHKTLKENENIIDMEHCNIVKTFKNKQLAKEINMIIKNIEDIDAGHLREVKGMLRAELSNLMKEYDAKKAKLAGE